MGIYEDIETQLGVSGSVTTQGAGSALNIDYVGGLITAFTDIEDLLTLPADFEDLNISLINGQVVSFYGDTTEFTLVYLVDDGTAKWCFCFKYADIDDYNAGKTIQIPPAELRV